MPPDQPSEPWHSLLAEVDRHARCRVDLVCIGGFAVTVAYGAPRTTADLDVLRTARNPTDTAVLALAARGGPVARHDPTLKLWIEMIQEDRATRW